MIENLKLAIAPYMLWVKVVAVAAVFLSGWWVNGWRWEGKYQTLESAYNGFVAGVKANGEKASAVAAKQVAADKLAKEQADEDNHRTHTTDLATIKRLRDAADRATGSRVPTAPTGTSRPDLACFDRPALESALGGFVAEIRGIADEGTACAIDLDSSKRWAADVLAPHPIKEK